MLIYAEITASRKDNVPLSTNKAYKRLISMIHSRTVAEATRWKKWAERSEQQVKTKVIPKKHREKTIYSQDWYGYFTVAEPILKELERTTAVKVRTTETLSRE